MKKVIKGLGVVLMGGVILASSFGSTASAAKVSYASSSFTYGVYIGGGSGTTFKNVSNPYFFATHKAVNSGAASGVIYQIRYTDGKVYKSVQKSGALTEKNVEFTGDMGSKKAYLRNMYNESTPQRANGDFNY